MPLIHFLIYPTIRWGLNGGGSSTEKLNIEAWFVLFGDEVTLVDTTPFLPDPRMFSVNMASLTNTRWPGKRS